MVTLSEEFKTQVIEKLIADRHLFDLSDYNFAKKFGMNPAIWSRLKNGERGNLLKATQYLEIGRRLNITKEEHKWVMVRTDVYNMIEEDVVFCQKHSKARICVDDCGIGKTFAAKHLARTLHNAFYIDGSQCKSKNLFIRKLAEELGIDANEEISRMIKNIKYCIFQIENPVVIVDEAGDFNIDVYQFIKELWNATENNCGWYLIGADGLRRIIEKGIVNKRVGFKELFSRFNDRFSSIVPTAKDEKQDFYKKLITQVLEANAEAGADVNRMVKRCLIEDANGQAGGLRRAQSVLIINKQYKSE